MAESHVISGLVSKRSELAGQIDYYQNQIKQMQIDVSAIDTAIKVFNPEYDLRTVKSKQYRIKNYFFKHGEGNRVLLDVFRETQGTTSTKDIVAEVAKRKSIELTDENRKALSPCIFVILKRLQSNGVIREAGRVDSVIQWEKV